MLYRLAVQFKVMLVDRNNLLYYTPYTFQPCFKTIYRSWKMGPTRHTRVYRFPSLSSKVRTLVHWPKNGAIHLRKKDKPQALVDLWSIFAVNLTGRHLSSLKRIFQKFRRTAKIKGDIFISLSTTLWFRLIWFKKKSN